MLSRPVTGSLNTVNTAVSIDTSEVGTVGIKVAGTFGATLAFEATLDGTNWDNVPVYTINSAPALVLNTINTAGLWRASTSGYAQFRVNCTSYTSNAATVTLMPCLSPFVN